MDEAPKALADLMPREPTTPGRYLPSPARLIPPTPARLDPGLCLQRSGKPLADARASVGDFWAWAFSDLRQNSVRGHLAEYIVAIALGVRLEVRSAWDDHDLLLTDLPVPRSSGGHTAARL